MGELSPATLEGWYALHQVVTVDWRAVRMGDAASPDELAGELASLLTPPADAEHGWSAAYQLVGGGADWLFVHFRRSLDELSVIEQSVRRARIGELLTVTYDFLSITETGLYHATAEAAREAEPGSKEFQQLIDEAAAAERASAHIQTRLFPRPPAAMRYISFYPMTKRRTHPDNWYALPVAERSRMMRDHGLTGRKYAGRVFQVITGSVGLDDWEWGVTLYAADPLEFKRIVTEMRYDEASTKYGEFGEFYTGIRIERDGWTRLLAGE